MRQEKAGAESRRCGQLMHCRGNKGSTEEKTHLNKNKTDPDDAAEKEALGKLRQTILF